ncbi:5-oxoprolinase subunit PxpB [Leifsonia sp. NPDC058194]|uniref:5-oxoprolinase subunit PxpB n=1 Tax=Leifsonia sp. NPDC058194 TaxID=3346374 RepID=UPI0036D93978
MSLRILPSGERALLAELDGLEDVLALYRALDQDRPAGVIDLVPAARTLGIVVDPLILPLTAAQAWVERARPVPAAGSVQAVVEIPVRYDGPDIAEAAALLDLAPAELIALHTSSSWHVAFVGFAPGFGYLVTDHDRLRIPRRATPRTSVPAGSVGLAGEFSGVYPRSSPGGWQLIGTTDAVLWDAEADPPALLRPGVPVRFREVP